MANEDLFKDLPANIERTAVPGPFFLRKHFDDDRGSRDIVVLTEVLVTCGGHPEGRDVAKRIAEGMNRRWHELCAEEEAKRLIECNIVASTEEAYKHIITHNPHLSFLKPPSPDQNQT